MNTLRLVCTALVITAATTGARAQTVELMPMKDNTLYETTDGRLSSGAGQHFFAGRVGVRGGGSIRRALLAFDVAGTIPPGSTIDSLTLTVNVSRTRSGAQTVSLHKVLTDWGEGTSEADANRGGQGSPSTPDDATWVHTFFDTDLWQNEGGDFSGTVTADLAVGSVGSYTWGPTPQMIADVQEWLDQPETNFGWILIGNEAAMSTAKRFDSRENSGSVRPMLTIDFTTGAPTPTQTQVPTPTPTPVLTPSPTLPPGTCIGDCNDDGQVTINELILGVNIALGVSPVSACPAFDPNDDGEVTIGDLIAAVNNAQNGCPV